MVPMLSVSVDSCFSCRSSLLDFFGDLMNNKKKSLIASLYCKIEREEVEPMTLAYRIDGGLMSLRRKRREVVMKDQQQARKAAMALRNALLADHPPCSKSHKVAPIEKASKILKCHFHARNIRKTKNW